MSPEPLALYIHWPFCLAKCPYCDFNSHVRPEGPDHARFTALTEKLDKLRDEKAAAEDRWLALAEEVEALG